MFFSLDTFRKGTPYNQKVYTTRECTVYTGETLYLCNHKYNPRRCLLFGNFTLSFFKGKPISIRFPISLTEFSYILRTNLFFMDGNTV